MIVFDSSTLILLAKAELLDVFLNDYNDVVVIPGSVENESTAKNTFDALLIRKRINEGKIKIKSVKGPEIGRFIQDFNINIGEAESIVLAIGKKAILATDDKKAINACRLSGIDFTTAIDILVRAYEKKLITQQQAQTKLDNISKYGRYSREIIENARNMLKDGGVRHAKNS